MKKKQIFLLLIIIVYSKGVLCQSSDFNNSSNKQQVDSSKTAGVIPAPSVNNYDLQMKVEHETNNKNVKEIDPSEAPILNDKKFKNCIECKDPNVLIYDFECKHFFYNNLWVKNLNKIKIKYNEEFKVKIVNINRYMYDIDFIVNDIEFGSQQPALFKQLFLGDGSYLNVLIDELGKQIASDKKEYKFRTTSSAGDFEKNLRTFMNEYYELFNSQIKANSFCETNFLCCDKEKDLFSNRARNFLLLKLSYLKYNEELVLELLEMQKKIDVLQKTSTQCKELNIAFDNESNSAKKDKIQKRIDSLNCETKQAELDELLKSKGSKEALKSGMEKLWLSINKITDQDIMKLVLFNNNLVADHFAYTSPPIYPQGNRLSLGLKIKPSDSSLVKKWNIMPLYNDSLGIDIFVKGKWFVSFSSGPFIGIGNNLRNESYDWQVQPNSNKQITDSSKYKLVSTGNGNIPLGIGAFANFGTKLSSNFGIGITTGVGIIVETKLKPVYIVGIPLCFGDQQQLNFSFGACLTQNQELKTELYPDRENTLYNNTTTIEYKPALGYGGFISISYTFFTSEKTKNTVSKSKR